jgi:sulfur carrier protein ThiS
MSRLTCPTTHWIGSSSFQKKAKLAWGVRTSYWVLLERILEINSPSRLREGESWNDNVPRFAFSKDILRAPNTTEPPAKWGQAMAHVQINVYASLRSYVGGAPSLTVEIEPGQTVQQLLEELGIPPEETRILFVNNRAAGLDQPLQGGERVGVFPAIGGG